jgi:hypothetical protein
LHELAIEEEKYRRQIAQIMCSHIRSKTDETEYKDTHSERPSNEIQTLCIPKIRPLKLCSIPKIRPLKLCIPKIRLLTLRTPKIHPLTLCILKIRLSII